MYKGWAGIFLGVEIFCHRHNSCVFLAFQEERPPALGHHLLCSLGKEKNEGSSELPIRIPESQSRAWAAPQQTDPPSEICMKWAESLRSPIHNKQEIYFTSWGFTLCSAKLDTSQSVSDRAGTQDSWALLFTGWYWQLLKPCFSPFPKTACCHPGSRP